MTIRNYLFSDLQMVRVGGLFLKNVENQNREICLAAVRQNGLALRYVKDQTYELCLEAVKQNGLALKSVLVKYKTNELNLEAVKKNPEAIIYVNNQTPEICFTILMSDIENIVFIKDIQCLFDLKNKTDLNYFIYNMLPYLPS